MPEKFPIFDRKFAKMYGVLDQEGNLNQQWELIRNGNFRKRITGKDGISTGALIFGIFPVREHDPRREED